ncbi:Txe/YoeB family addiction module toxin [Alphaproteobacteria bacterium]|nr:Txe/YoeB family addiction module toxin [Alphaproteobacteria bacterium]
MVIWKIKYAKHVLADSLKLKSCGLKKKVEELISIISKTPYQTPLHFEKLDGFENVYSRRINIKHRLVYQVLKDEMIVKVISMWGHYDDN